MVMRATRRACGLRCTLLLALYACSGDGPTQPTVRVEYQGEVGYTFLDSSFYNVEYWAGNTAIGRHTVAVRLFP